MEPAWRSQGCDWSNAADVWFGREGWVDEKSQAKGGEGRVVLYPFIVQLERVAGFARDDTVEGKLAKLKP